MAVWAAVIGGIVSAASAIGGGVAQKNATEKANRMNLALGEQGRQDVLGQNRASRRMQKEQFGFQKKQAALGRSDQKEEQAFQRKQGAAAKGLALLNSNQNLLANMSRMWGGK